MKAIPRTEFYQFNILPIQVDTYFNETKKLENSVISKIPKCQFLTFINDLHDIYS